MHLSQLCRGDTLTLSAEASVQNAAELMRTHSALGHAEGCHPHIRCGASSPAALLGAAMAVGGPCAGGLQHTSCPVAVWSAPLLAAVTVSVVNRPARSAPPGAQINAPVP